MKIADADILLLPGLGKSGPSHWLRRWQDKMANAKVVEQDNWDAPEFEPWISNIERAIIMATRPVILVGHSLGALSVVHVAQRLKDTKVKGAFLVCPPNLDQYGDMPADAEQFGILPRDPLPFPSLLIASNNDTYCTIERAADLANALGSEFHEAGDAGHINEASGHGPWPDGLMMFTRLMQRSKA